MLLQYAHPPNKSGQAVLMSYCRCSSGSCSEYVRSLRQLLNRITAAQVCDAPIFIGIPLRFPRDDDSSTTAGKKIKLSKEQRPQLLIINF